MAGLRIENTLPKDFSIIEGRKFMVATEKQRNSINIQYIISIINSSMIFNVTLFVKRKETVLIKLSQLPKSSMTCKGDTIYIEKRDPTNGWRPRTHELISNNLHT